MQLVSAPLRQRASSVHQQQAVDHVAEEVGLLGLAELADGHVGQQLALQDLARVLDAPLARHARHAAALADVVQRDLQGWWVLGFGRMQAGQTYMPSYGGYQVTSPSIVNFRPAKQGTCACRVQ